MSTTYDAVSSLTTIQCCCGGTYAISETYRAQKHQEGGAWTCPYCQTGWGYGGRGENARLKREAEAARQLAQRANERAAEYRQQAETQGRRAAAARGQVTKIKKRVANGSCPCCRQNFANLAAHMQTQHPDYAVAND
jgi:hypothetical protein